MAGVKQAATRLVRNGQVLRCTQCGFAIPAAPLDPAGVAIMQAHLDEHQREKRDKR